MPLSLLDFVYAVASRAVSVFNFLEAIFWIGVSLGFVGTALRIASPRARILLLAGVVLLFFGVSDLVEAQSGAWWRPWWLLVWKGVCGISLVLLYTAHRFVGRAAAKCHELYWTG
jgi:hypothetical protein